MNSMFLGFPTKIGTSWKVEDILAETDLLIEKLSPKKEGKSFGKKGLNDKDEELGEVNQYVSKIRSKEQEDSNFMNGIADYIPKKKDRRRANLCQAEEEDEIEKILSSKKYEQPSKHTKIKNNFDKDLLDDLDDEKSATMNGDPASDFREFLNKFKKDKQALFGRDRKFVFEQKRSVETEEFIKDRTRNIRAVIDQQANICENVSAVSKQLDDLEKELREVRQITLERKSRIEALENAVNSERKLYEIEHNSAVERSKNKKPIEKYTQEVKNQFTANVLKQSALGKTDPQDEILSILTGSKRRGGSVCSMSSLMDEQERYFSPSFNASSEFQKYRSSSKERDLLGNWNFEKRESSASRDIQNRNSFAERTNFDYILSGQPDLVTHTRPRHRASLATMDLTNATADDFLLKIRSKYSFLHSNEPPKNFGAYEIDSNVSSDKNLSGADYFEGKNRAIGPPPNTYNHLARSQAPTRGFPIPVGPESLSSYSAAQSKRAISASDGRSSIHYDKKIGGYTALTAKSQFTPIPAVSAVPVRAGVLRGFESKYNPPREKAFKSRFLDKVRERRAGAIEHIPGTSQLADRVMAKLNSQKEQPTVSPAKMEAEEKETIIKPEINGEVEVQN